MFNTIKKVLLSSLSILGICSIVWLCLFLNPNYLYANSTTIENVTIHHNKDLAPEASVIVNNALEIIKSSALYDKDFSIDFCLNDNAIYPKLHPLASGIAYAFLNKTVIYASQPDFENNLATYTWEINNNEFRKYNLTALIAHEFMHNFQYHHNPNYYNTTTFGKLNWKFEGHADFISRKFKNDDLLIDKITFYLKEEKKEHVGIPVFTLSDGTIQILTYFKYALVVQYLLEEKEMSFQQLCDSERPLDEVYNDMLIWYKAAK